MVLRGDCFEIRVPENAFGESPNPRFLYCSAFHARALAGLLESLERGDRLQVLTARPGAGKTTVLKALLERLGDRVDSAFVFYTCGMASDLLGFINREFSIPDPGTDLASRHEALLAFLRTRARPVVLVIDEAQSLDGSAFEAIDRILADAPKCLRVVLSGQARLTMLLTAAQRRLQESVTARHELGPLDLDDTSKYIRHRLEVAGYSGPELFTREALELIAAKTEGIPRNVNTLCFHALHGYSVTEVSRIDANAVSRALERCAFTESALAEEKSIEFKQAPASASPEAANLGSVLRRWLTTHAGVWSGTAWELQNQIASASADADSSQVLSHLERITERGSPAVLDCGVAIELCSRAGSPRQFVIRLAVDSCAEKNVSA